MRNPRHILITGASSGIGAALAEAYAAPGITLALHGRNRERLDHVAESARQRGAEVTVTIVDVTDAESMAAWISECDARQPIDLIIANAGVSLGKNWGGETDQESRAMFDINVTGVLNTVQPVLPLMKARKRGQIAIVSSLASFRGLYRGGSYSATKAAVRIYGEALRSSVMQYGIEVNVICPGFIKTPMTDVNNFPMPLMMPVDKAARIIQDGLAKNRGRIAFPWAMYMLVWLLAALPPSWADALMQREARKRR